jgi:carbonic anhydrase
MRMPCFLLSTFLFAVIPAAASEEGHAHWEYSGQAGPEHWGELQPDFGLCSSGTSQSPIDLSHMVDKELPSVSFEYQPGGYRVVNNGHAVQVDFNPGSRIHLDGASFELKQVHFHTPSENTIEGKHFPMEAHLVHSDARGHLAVVAVLFEAGAANAGLAQFSSRVSRKPQSQSKLAALFAASTLLPEDRDYYRFSGSLTTPPCSEDVRWLVLKHPETASAGQIAMLHDAIGHDNNRPVQPVGARTVLQ